MESNKQQPTLDQRHKRNIAIPGFGEAGQQALRCARVLVVGAGGLGSPVLYYLAAAGVGTLGIVDSDNVDISNLQRQILHHTADLGRPKVLSAQEKLQALDPDVRVVAYSERFTAANAAELVRQYDFVIDCCDNFETKYLINDTCVAERKPFSHGAVTALRGEVMTCVPGSADYRCVFGDTPQSKPNDEKSFVEPQPESVTVTGEKVPLAPDEAPGVALSATATTTEEPGVLGAMAGLVGSIQATEAIKYLTGIGDLILNRILILDGMSMTFLSLRV